MASKASNRGLALPLGIRFSHGRDSSTSSRHSMNGGVAWADMRVWRCTDVLYV
jgi:hypothetical protein